MMLRYRLSAMVMCTGLIWCSAIVVAQRSDQKTFETPEAAVHALTEAAIASDMTALLAIFGSDGQDLINSSDAATARQNRDVFTAAVAEGWRLVDHESGQKALIVGNEGWPFPVPLVKTAGRWRFDSAAGKEEVLARRIGRNELAVIGVCAAYVSAQRHYARQGHDGKSEGLFATSFSSSPGKQNGLYWPAVHGQPDSPLGALVAEASQQGRPVGGSREGPSPFHGYYFKILTAQGTAAPGGAKSYAANGEMSGGFALLAWPAQYDATGIMTFTVNQDGVVYETDLGPQSAVAAASITTYNPDASWRHVK
jgi:hypothetical protein